MTNKELKRYMIIQRTEKLLLTNRSFLNYFSRSPDAEYLLVREMSLLQYNSFQLFPFGLFQCITAKLSLYLMIFTVTFHFVSYFSQLVTWCTMKHLTLKLES